MLAQIRASSEVIHASDHRFRCQVFPLFVIPPHRANVDTLTRRHLQTIETHEGRSFYGVAFTAKSACARRRGEGLRNHRTNCVTWLSDFHLS